jgi:hypothetical protein
VNFFGSIILWGERIVLLTLFRVSCGGFVEDIIVVLLRSLLEVYHGGHRGCWGFWARGARKPQGFLELGIRRGFVPSWLGGKDLVFRKFQAVFRQFQVVATTRKKGTNFFFKRYFSSINFIQNESYDMNLCMENV